MCILLLFVEGALKILPENIWLERKIGVVLERETLPKGGLVRKEYAQCRYHLITRPCRDAKGVAMTQLRILFAKDLKESPGNVFNHWIGDFSACLKSCSRVTSAVSFLDKIMAIDGHC